MLFSRRTRTFLVPFIAVALLGACGDDDDDTATGSDADEVTETTAAPVEVPGLTEDTIKLGFTHVNYGGVQAGGVNLGPRDDITDVIDALVDAANADGGVNGHQIEAVKVPVNIVDSADQRTKCLQLTEDEEVYAVIDSYTFSIYPASRACIAIEHETPLISGAIGGQEDVDAAFPYLVSVAPPHNQRAIALVETAESEGFFDPANGFEKLGIFTDRCAEDALEDLNASLEELGITDVSEFRADCALAAQQGAGEPAVLQFQQDGVSHVLLATIGPAVGPFLTAAAAQGFDAEYFVSDFWSLTNDATAAAFNPDLFDRTRGVTSLHEGEMSLGMPLSEPAQACSDIMTEAGLPEVNSYSRDSEALYLCDSLRLFIAAAEAADDPMTREAWAEGLQTLGEFPASWVASATFEEGKVTGGDSIAVIEWQRECTCWKQVSDFRPM